MKRDENQNVEHKESWPDKCPEWICGYANAKIRTAFERFDGRFQAKR